MHDIQTYEPDHVLYNILLLLLLLLLYVGPTVRGVY